MSQPIAALFSLEDEAPAPQPAPEPEQSGSASHPTLYGADPTPAVVAVEVRDRTAILIRAEGESRFREERPFRPWLLADAALARGQVPGPLADAAWTQLEGEGLAWLIEPASWRQFLACRDALRQLDLPHLAYGSPVKQFLVRSGVTLFGGLALNDVRRMQFDLETTGLRWDAPDARVLMIAVTDNRGGEWLLDDADEVKLIEQFVQLVGQVDPDVIEGHNIFGFDIPYLAARAARARVRLALGRDGSLPTSGHERSVTVGGSTRPFTHSSIWGRHLVDTLIAVQRFDVARGELESYGLKAVARHFGFAESGRVYLDASQMTKLAEEDPERVRLYALQDTRETRMLAELVTPADFYSTQMIPDTYGAVATGGAGEKINSLLVREYLRAGHAVPLPRPPTPCPGGYTEVRRTGVIHGVVKADVESLYPSIMLNFGIQPQADRLGVFTPLLAELTRQRLEAKGRARVPGPMQSYWDGLQGSFKILINSFYGYLGAPFHFNDFDAARQVTTTGQELVRRVAAALEESGSQVIEIDTDGVYFTPPAGVATREQEERYIEQIGEVLPAGIRLAHDGRYPVMVSLKVKNYVLVDESGRTILKGAAVRSRADEPFGRKFISRAIECLISGDCDALAAEYRALADRLEAGHVPVEELARRERVTEKTLSSPAGRRLREIAGASGVGDRLQVYERSDGSLGLVSDYRQDECRYTYLDKLHRFALRLADALPENEMQRLCPPPDRRRFMAKQAGQLDLF